MVTLTGTPPRAVDQSVEVPKAKAPIVERAFPNYVDLYFNNFYA